MPSYGDPMAFYTGYANFVESVALRFAPVVKKYGWDRDDCCQHAYMKLWKLSARQDLREWPSDEVKKYLAVAVKRAIYRAAINRIVVGYPLNEVTRTVAEAEAKTQDAETYLLTEVLDAAPGEIGVFLRERLLNGMPILDIAVDRGWTRHRLVTIRAEAAEWLLAQFEGRKMSRG